MRAKQKRQHAVHSPRKVKPIVSSHKKGTAPEKQQTTICQSHKKGTVPEKQIVSSHQKGTAPNQTDWCVISQERDRFLKHRQRPQSKLSQQITNCGWISGKPCHNMWAWLCDSRFLSQGFCTSPSVVKQCCKRIFKHFAYCPGDSTRSVQWVMIQDKPGHVFRSSVLDHSWTPFNQRPSDSRNCCRAREEPRKPCQEYLFSSTLFFFDGDKLIQSFSQRCRATKFAHVEDGH